MVRMVDKELIIHNNVAEDEDEVMVDEETIDEVVADKQVKVIMDEVTVNEKLIAAKEATVDKHLMVNMMVPTQGLE